MKKVLSIVVFFFLIACSSDSDTVSFKLSQTSFELNRPQQTIEVQISSNSSWLATDIPEWITLQYTQGNGSTSLEIVVSQNNDLDGQTRTGVVKFVSNNKVYLLTIIQTAVNEVTISILNNEIRHLDFNQHVFTIQISSIQPWYLQSKPAWVQVNPSTGNAGTTSVEITILENNTMSYRLGRLIFATETPFNLGNNLTWASLDLDQTINPVISNETTIHYWELIKGNAENTIDHTQNLSSDFKNNTYYLMHTTGSTGHIDKFNGIWSNYGDLNNFYYPKMAVANNGIPYAVSKNTAYNNGNLTVSKFNPNLINIPDFLQTTGNSSFNIALDSNENIYVGDLINNNLSIYKYTSLWTNIGNFNDNLITSSHILKVSSNNTPYIAYQSEMGIYIKSFDGSSWNTVGGSALDTSSSLYGFQVGSDNSLYVAYSKNYNYIIKKFTNGSWSTIGSFTSSNLNLFKLFLDNNNNPYVYINDKIHQLINYQWNELEPFKIIYNNQVIDYSDTSQYIINQLTMSFDQNNKMIVAFALSGSLSLKVLKYTN